MNFVANLARRGAGLTPALTPRASTEPHFDAAPPPSAQPARDTAAVSPGAPRVEPSPPATLPRAVEQAQSHEASALFPAPPISAHVEPHVTPAPRPVTPSISRVESLPIAIKPRTEIADVAREADIVGTLRPPSRQPEATHETRHESAPDTRAPQTTSALVMLEPRAPEMFEREVLAPRVLPSVGAPSEPNEPRIHVRIGQVQVRLQKPPPPRPAAPPRTARGFDDFARARAYIDRIY